ncbi:PREDICTED: protein FAR1-RELATED SEQUENCE 5-like [Erythranthe guttata]|uniref:protein FAR1-RELATED SEQUENCE 5-like n=1 Tax=Erythranthe guttata TaxID=4155 RepID=UPI00064E1326|nr:PREDICTED: protein FAR1-RELATED SEQUENCE 5-like [Erythranthe guttata]|eukprot:XP_012837783.1 PREDICTED: protein FAR1-RELATED SEQUENCE 5-like [Erythranthe guttata]
MGKRQALYFVSPHIAIQDGISRDMAKMQALYFVSPHIAIQDGISRDMAKMQALSFVSPHIAIHDGNITIWRQNNLAFINEAMQTQFTIQADNISSILTMQPTNKVKQNEELAIDYSSEFINQDTFATRDELLKWVREVGRRLGMVFTIMSSNPGLNRRRTPYMVLVCERAGEYRGTNVPGKFETAKRKRSTRSKKCNCLYKLKGTKLGMDDDNVGWKLEFVFGVHNHPCFPNLEGHAYAARLTSEEMKIVEEMSNALVQPKAILTTLKKRDETNVAEMKTIYNARHRLQALEKAGRSQMQLLMTKLSEHNYLEDHRSNEDGEVTDLFWSNPTCLALGRSFPYVLLMDCTYKTNRYGFPLLEMVGVTSTNKTFSIAFAYLQFEKADNYEWALRTLVEKMGGSHSPNCIITERDLALIKAIALVYLTSHHLLCRWHVSKNILAKCQKMFKKEKEKWKRFETSWENLVEQESEELFYVEWDLMKRNFVDFPKALSYVADSWLDPYKQRNVSAWTDKCMHLGT